MLVRFLTALSLAAIAASAFAQSEPIDADRPGVAESPHVVGARVFQAELGLQGEKEDGSRQETTPLLLRYGLTHSLELRVETDGYTRLREEMDGETRRESGMSPLALGAKLQLIEGEDDATLEALSLLATVDLPSGSGAFHQDDPSGELRLLATLHPAKKWSLTPNAGIAFSRASGDTERAFTASAELEYELTERVHPFVELARDVPGDDGESPLLADGGVAWIVRDDLQLDAAIGRRIGDNGPDFLWTFGVSRRFGR